MCASEAYIRDVSTLTKERKSQRLVARISRDHKRVLQRAAVLEGRSLATFVVAHAVANAERILSEHQAVQLNAADSRRFVEALLAPPRPATSALKRALSRYHAQVREA